MIKIYKGKCFCGVAEITVTGKPVVMGFCHCESCRSWSAAPVNAFTLWQPDAVKVTAGETNIASFSKTPNSVRKWCKLCGGHIMTDHPKQKLVDVPAAVLPDLKFEPREHQHYQEAVLRITDSLPKNKDLARGGGGSGVLLPS